MSTRSWYRRTHLKKIDGEWEMFWVLFFITDNQEFQHGSPGILGFIFYNGQSRNP